MPGHMGNDTVTTIALEVVRVDAAQNLLLVKGSVPGYDKSVVYIRRSYKPPKLHGPAVQHKKKSAQAGAAKQAAQAKEKAAAAAPKGKK